MSTYTRDQIIESLRFRPGELEGSDLRGVNLDNVDFADLLATPYLPNANLSGASLCGSVLPFAILKNADLTRAALCCAYLANCDFTGANLSNADLAGANLQDATLDGSDLTRANLSWAHLGGASLRGANLVGADLTGANLSQADLRDANLQGATLASAKLGGADLSRTRHDRSTNWPRGFTPPPDAISVDRAAPQRFVDILDLRTDEERKIEQEAIAGESLGPEVDPLVDELIVIGRQDGFLSMQPGGKFDEDRHHKRAREIGTKLNDMGGKDLMIAAHYRIRVALGGRLARELEYAWEYIGGWLP